jgi:riboflavin kinase / FMN adenylyltransferase
VHRALNLESLGPEFHRGAVTIGNFDGVHRGHAQILQRVRAWADKVAGPALVLTFDPHPVRILRPESAPVPLTWHDRKADLLEEWGIDALVAIPTNRDLLELTALDFFETIIVKKLNAKAIVEGPNFFFGKGREGNIDLLSRLCGPRNIQLEIVPPLRHGTELISSSRIRHALQHGDVTLAAEMLTHPYRLRGLVVHGDRRGTTLGFPTANLDGIDTLVPALGVYSGRTLIAGTAYPAAIHIGHAPTFGVQQRRVEVHLLDFSGNLYGSPLEIEFLARLREIVSFPSREALQAQLGRDIASTRTHFSQFVDP